MVYVWETMISLTRKVSHSSVVYSTVYSSVYGSVYRIDSDRVEYNRIE